MHNVTPSPTPIAAVDLAADPDDDPREWGIAIDLDEIRFGRSAKVVAGTTWSRAARRLRVSGGRRRAA